MTTSTQRSKQQTPKRKHEGSVLVINCGSSSIKYQLVHPHSGQMIAAGLAERIGEAESVITHRVGDDRHTQTSALADHTAAMNAIIDAFRRHGPDLAQADVAAVGHRVVQGGSRFDTATMITQEVEREIEDLQDLAPLHNPPALAGIRAARRMLPEVDHVAVFDTAFFANLPAAAARYAIPRDLADRYAIRRYGAHGTNHEHVSTVAAALLDREPSELNQVTLHLGNGCSAAAIAGGHPVDTSMGLTPLQGLVMGTRSGDVDPSLHAYLGRVAGMELTEIDHLLNSRSGLLGLAGVNDMRELLRLRSAGDPHAEEAWQIYVHRIRHYVGAYAFLLGRLDAITFTGGVGENVPELRAAVLGGLSSYGIELDPPANDASSDQARLISRTGRRVAVLVVPAAEELAIARQAVGLIGRAEG